jgi:hypothetical protein
VPSAYKLYTTKIITYNSGEQRTYRYIADSRHQTRRHAQQSAGCCYFIFWGLIVLSRFWAFLNKGLAKAQGQGGYPKIDRGSSKAMHCEKMWPFCSLFPNSPLPGFPPPPPRCSHAGDAPPSGCALTGAAGSLRAVAAAVAGARGSDWQWRRRERNLLQRTGRGWARPRPGACRCPSPTTRADPGCNFDKFTFILIQIQLSETTFPRGSLHQDVERASYKRDGRSAQQDHLVGDQDEDAAREER